MDSLLQGMPKELILKVEPNYTQLSPSSVFILDYGHEIYQWNGPRSLLHHRLKARLICTRINTAERKGRARFSEMNAKEEIPRFWDILGGEPENDECQDLLESPAAEWRTPVLYGYVSVIALWKC